MYLCKVSNLKLTQYNTQMNKHVNINIVWDEISINVVSLNGLKSKETGCHTQHIQVAHIFSKLPMVAYDNA